MSLITRSFSAGILFACVLMLAWLAPGPSEKFEIGGSTAYAGGTKSKTKKKTTASKTATTAAKKHHVHLMNDIKLLKAARKNLASTPLHYGGHREKALNHINSAIHQLTILEHHLKKLAAGKKK